MMKPRRSSFDFALVATVLVASSACTVTSTEDPMDEGGSGGSSSAAGSSNAGNAGAAAAAAGGGGGEAGATGTAGMAGATGSTNCGQVGIEGVCEGDVLQYCNSGELVAVDCAQVNLACALDAGEASCTDIVRAAACGNLTEEGICEGAVMRFCDQSGVVGVARSINCAAYGQLCDPTSASDGGALCVPQGPCPSNIDENGVCNANELQFCEDGDLFLFDCGLDECRDVGGFSDCFVADFQDGCGTVPVEGICSAGIVNRCLGNVVTREDCEALGLECVTTDAGASCQRVNCPADCATGYTCTDGVCVPDTQPDREWTVAIYVVGDNNLSDALWQDLNEMETVGSNTDVQVVAEIEFSSTFSSEVPSGYRTGAYRMVVEQDSDPDSSASLDGGTDLGDSVNMGSSAALTDFLRWTAENYPAQKIALILSDHGMGYQGGFYDTGENSLMTLRDLVAGVRDSGVHLDMLGMDACMMGMHEVGLAFRGVADTMVASQEVEPGSGYPYDEILTALQSTPTMTAPEWGEVIVNDYTAGFDSGLRRRSVTMATIDLATLPAVNEQLAAFTETVLRETPGMRSSIKNAVSSTELMRSKTADITDIGSILDVFSSLDGAIGTTAGDTRTWMDASGAVSSVRGTVTKEGTSGLAIYLPEIAWSQYSSGTFGPYWLSTSFLPLQPWYTFVGNLSSSEEAVITPGEGAVDWFSVVLSWGNTSGGNVSLADLDLYVYEPNGDFGTPANGSTTPNGLLSADSYDTDIPAESYELQPEHETGTYIILVSLYDLPVDDQAFPRLQIYRNDLPGGSRTLLRGKVVDRELVEIPMDASNLLTETVAPDNFQGVLDLEYSNLWYATTIEVQ